jgi:glycosyltransferase involved in cell wall biosynthesis
MFCSTIIPTVGRPTLSRSVNSVLDQTFTADDFEIIVVNDSGHPLHEAAWQKSERVKIINTQQRERSVARNAGAAIAQGKYLHFLDDDDWILPGAFEQIWHLSQTSTAAWLYGGYNLIDNDGNLLEECHPNEKGNCFIRFMAGEWLPLQVSFIHTNTFFAVGGFTALNILLGGDEDVHLSRLVSLNEDIAGTRETIGAIRVGLAGSTTNYTNLHQQSLVSREQILNMPGAFSRMQTSAKSREQNQGYWHGRITWIYLGSIIWNLRRKKLLTAISRGFYSLLSIATKYIFSQDYWRGAAQPHVAKGWLNSNGD